MTKPIKICSCGHEFHKIPSDAVDFMSDDTLAGVYMTCPWCGSTSFLRASDRPSDEFSVSFDTQTKE